MLMSAAKTVVMPRERIVTGESQGEEENVLNYALRPQRFAQYIGQPPMQYLAQWRMQLAAGMLRNGTASVAAIADEMGYASEAAFSRAFKKVVGTPPGTWRREGSKSASE